MSSSRIPSLQEALSWPLKFRTTTIIIATSGLCLALFAVSSHIWRGGGKKGKDPGGKGAVKGRRGKSKDDIQEQTDNKDSPLQSKSKRLLEVGSDALELGPRQTPKVAQEVTRKTATQNCASSLKREEPPLQKPQVAFEKKGNTPFKSYSVLKVDKKPQELPCVAQGIKEEEATANISVALKLAEKPPKYPRVTLKKKGNTQSESSSGVVKVDKKPQELPCVAQEIKEEEATVNISVTLEEKENPPQQPQEALENKGNIPSERNAAVLKVDDKPKELTDVAQGIKEEAPVNISAAFKVEEKPPQRTEVAQGIKEEVTPQNEEQAVKSENPSTVVHKTEGTSFPAKKTNKVPSPLIKDSKDQVFFVGKDWVNIFPIAPLSTADSSKEEECSLSVEIRGDCPAKAETEIKEVVDNSENSNCFVQAEDHIPKQVLGSLEVIPQTSQVLDASSCQPDTKTTVGDVKTSIHLQDTEKQIENSSVYPSKADEPVVAVDEQLRLLNEGSPKFLQCDDKQLEKYSPSPSTAVETVEIVSSVDIELEELPENQYKSSSAVGAKSQFKDYPISSHNIEEVEETITLVDTEGGGPQDLADCLEDSKKQLEDSLVSSLKTEDSVNVSVREEKVLEPEQVIIVCDFPKGRGEVECEEVVSPNQEKTVEDSGDQDKGAAKEGGEGGGFSCQDSVVSEVTTTAARSEECTIADEEEKVVTDKLDSEASDISTTKEAGAISKVVEDSEIPKTRSNDIDNADIILGVKEGVEGLGKEEAVFLPLTKEKEVMLTKGAEAKSDVVRGVGGSGTGKRKGKKGKKKLGEVAREEGERVEAKNEMGDAEEPILQNGDLAEEHHSKCTNQSHASGLSSPSMSNFPDNRSEGSSCGDSGKGRSDVTTPGGLEEELREVNFSHQYSPPCSTSGPEEEEDEAERLRRDSGSTVEDGSRGEVRSTAGGEDMMEDSAAMVGNGGLILPVAVPFYPGMVPLTPPPSVYEFVIPQGLVGRLIGKHGSFVNQIKARTSASIFIKTHPETNKLKVCAIEGTDDEIQSSLQMIREKFPLRRYSSMTLEQVFFLPLPPPTLPLIPDSLPLQLVEGVSNDVILSAMVSPGHYFLQQPTHPTYPTLAKLDMWMAMCYQDANAPMLPEGVRPGIICAAPTMGGWYRAQVVAVEEIPSTSDDDSTEEGELVKWCDIRFVDYGGYERVPSHFLRQIRSDFMTLPFQASECYLASVVPTPTSDENKTADGWSMEAYALVEELTQAQVLKAQVVGHTPDGLPLVLLYAFSHSYGQVVQVNGELVNRGLAVWAVPVVETDQIAVVDNEDGADKQPPAEQSEITA